MLERRKPTNTKEAIIQIYDILVDLERDYCELSKEVKAQNGRVGRLERWQAYISGGAAIVGVVIGLAIRSIPDLLKALPINIK